LADEVGEARENYQQRNTMRAQKSNDPFPDYENSSNEAVRGLEKGARVRHPTFGVGTIYKTEGNGEDQKVSVLFQDNTIKKFVVKYARLEMV
jgi:DNA helicase-2/ATP-dependent DNA helicase PcrA